MRNRLFASAGRVLDTETLETEVGDHRDQQLEQFVVSRLGMAILLSLQSQQIAEQKMGQRPIFQSAVVPYHPNIGIGGQQQSCPAGQRNFVLQQKASRGGLLPTGSGADLNHDPG